jgi:hypothetical protein
MGSVQSSYPEGHQRYRGVLDKRQTREVCICEDVKCVMKAVSEQNGILACKDCNCVNAQKWNK